MTVRSIVLMAMITGAAIASLRAEQKVQMKDLPTAVQKAIQDQTAGAQLKGLSKEVEGGKTFYEAETVVNGRTRDLLFDASGNVVEIEEQTTVDEVPAAVKTALSTRGRILRLEKLTKGDKVAYEAQVEKNGRKSEVVLDAAGKPVKM